MPTRCACADGVRKSVAVRYAARPSDTLGSIAEVVFAGLPSADQIRTANGLAAEDPDAPLSPGQKLVIPLPCVCFNSTDNNLPAVYLSYVVQVGDTVESIAASHTTTVTDISNVNAMGSPIVAPGDILAIPLPGKIHSLDRSMQQDWNKLPWPLQSHNLATFHHFPLKLTKHWLKTYVISSSV
jgi:LysM repeat protein